MKLSDLTEKERQELMFNLGNNISKSGVSFEMALHLLEGGDSDDFKIEPVLVDIGEIQ